MTEILRKRRNPNTLPICDRRLGDMKRHHVVRVAKGFKFLMKGNDEVEAVREFVDAYPSMAEMMEKYPNLFREFLVTSGILIAYLSQTVPSLRRILQSPACVLAASRINNFLTSSPSRRSSGSSWRRTRPWP